jgi:hypothetical protein
LRKNRTVFHESRKAADLRKRWSLLKKANLLVDQTIASTVSMSTQIENCPCLMPLNDKLAQPFELVEASIDDKEIMKNVELIDEHIEKGFSMRLFYHLFLFTVFKFVDDKLVQKLCFFFFLKS